MKWVIRAIMYLYIKHVVLHQKIKLCVKVGLYIFEVLLEPMVQILICPTEGIRYMWGCQNNTCTRVNITIRKQILFSLTYPVNSQNTSVNAINFIVYDYIFSFKTQNPLSLD